MLAIITSLGATKQTIDRSIDRSTAPPQSFSDGFIRINNRRSRLRSIRYSHYPTAATIPPSEPRLVLSFHSADRFVARFGRFEFKTHRRECSEMYRVTV
jgi:hypothetical protein